MEIPFRKTSEQKAKEKQLLNNSAWHSYRYHEEQMQALEGKRLGKTRRFFSELFEGVNGWNRTLQIRDAMRDVGHDFGDDAVLTHDYIRDIVQERDSHESFHNTQRVTEAYHILKANPHAEMSTFSHEEIQQAQQGLNAAVIHPELYDLTRKRAIWSGVGYGKLILGVGATAVTGVGLPLIPAVATSFALGVVGNDNSIRLDEAVHQTEKAYGITPSKQISKGLWGRGNIDLEKENSNRLVLGKAALRTAINTATFGSASILLGEGIHLLADHVAVSDPPPIKMENVVINKHIPAVSQGTHDPVITDLHGHFGANIILPKGLDLKPDPSHPGTYLLYEPGKNGQPDLILANDFHKDSVFNGIDAHWLVPIQNIHPGITGNQIDLSGDVDLGSIHHGVFDLQHADNVTGGKWITIDLNKLPTLPHLIADSRLPVLPEVTNNTSIVFEVINGKQYALVENLQSGKIIGAFDPTQFTALNHTTNMSVNGFNLPYFNLTSDNIPLHADASTIAHFLHNPTTVHVDSIGNGDFSQDFATNIVQHLKHGYWYKEAGAANHATPETDVLRHVISLMNLPGEQAQGPVPGGLSSGGFFPIHTPFGTVQLSALPGWFVEPNGSVDHMEHFSSAWGAFNDRIGPEWLANMMDRVGVFVAKPPNIPGSHIQIPTFDIAGIVGWINNHVPTIILPGDHTILHPYQYPLSDVEHFQTGAAMVAHNFIPFMGDWPTHGLVDPAGIQLQENALESLVIGGGAAVVARKFATDKWFFPRRELKHKGRLLGITAADLLWYHLFSPGLASVATLTYLGLVGASKIRNSIEHTGGRVRPSRSSKTSTSAPAPQTPVQPNTSPQQPSPTAPSAPSREDIASAVALIPFFQTSAMTQIAYTLDHPTATNQQKAAKLLVQMNDALTIRGISNDMLPSLLENYQRTHSFTKSDLQNAQTMLAIIPMPSSQEIQQAAPVALQEVELSITKVQQDTSLSQSQKASDMNELVGQQLYLKKIIES